MLPGDTLKSALDMATVVKPSVLTTTMETYGWWRGRRIRVERYDRNLSRAGYQTPPIVLSILEEFGALPIKVRRLNQFIGVVKWPTRFEKIVLTVRWNLFNRLRSDEARIVGEISTKYFADTLVRIGQTRRSLREVEHAGSSCRGILFSDSVGRIHDLQEFQGKPFVATYTSIADYFALKCVSLRLLDVSKISETISTIPSDEEPLESAVVWDFAKLACMFGVL